MSKYLPLLVLVAVVMVVVSMGSVTKYVDVGLNRGEAWGPQSQRLQQNYQNLQNPGSASGTNGLPNCQDNPSPSNPGSYGTACNNPTDPCAGVTNPVPGTRCYGQAVTGDSSYTQTNNGGYCLAPYSSDFLNSDGTTNVNARNQAAGNYNECLQENGGAKPRFNKNGIYGNSGQTGNNNPTTGSVTVTDLTFNADAYVNGVWYVEQGGSYTANISGTFSDNAWFGAVYKYNNSAEVKVPNWQIGKSQIHLVTTQMPIGDYTMTQLYVNTSTVVWTGSKTIRVVARGDLPKGPAPTMSGKVTNQNSQPLAGVKIYYNSTVVPTACVPWLENGQISVDWQDFSVLPGNGGMVRIVNTRGWCEGYNVFFAWGYSLVKRDGEGLYVETPPHPSSDARACDDKYGMVFDSLGRSSEILVFRWAFGDSNDLSCLGSSSSVKERTISLKNTNRAIPITMQEANIFGAIAHATDNLIGTTNDAGEIVFTENFVQLLTQIFGTGKVSVSNGMKTITLPAGTLAIPGGLVVRYEYSGAKTTKTIQLVNGRFNLDTQIVSGGTVIPIGTISKSTPVINSFSPLVIDIGGGDESARIVTVRGSGFGSNTTIKLGDSVITPQSLISSTTLTFIVPDDDDYLLNKAFRLQLQNGTGRVSKFSAKILNVVAAGDGATIDRVIPVSLSKGRIQTVYVYGKNIFWGLELAAGPGIQIVGGSTTYSGLANNNFRLRFKVNVSSSLPAGIYFVSVSDGEGNEIAVPIVVSSSGI